MDSSMMHTSSSVKSENQDKLVMISLGDNLKVTRAAFYTLVAGVVFALVVAFTTPVWGPIVAIVTLLIWMLAAYNVNCVQVGHCYTWGWVLTTVYLVTVSFALVKLFLLDGKKMAGPNKPTTVSARKTGKK